MVYIDTKRRAKAATVVVGGKPKYPIDNKETAAAALRRIGQAKPPLTSSQKGKVRAKAARYGAGTSTDAPQKGSSKKKDI